MKPIFEKQDQPMVWPPAPSPPRVRYVGQLRRAADLKPPPNFWKGLERVLVGAEPPRPLYGPRAVVSSRDGQRLWVADPGGRCLHMFDLERRVYARISQLGNKPLLSPVSLCLGDGESIYVCDSESGSIHHISSLTGELLETVRVPEDINRPVSLAYDPFAGELYVVDVASHDIKVLDVDGRLLRIIGRRGTAPGEFNFPCAIAFDRDGIWVADTGNQRVQRLSPTGEAIALFGQAGDAPGDLALPKGIATDSDGHLYVVDARFENVQIFDRSGRLLLTFGQEGTGPGEFWLPAGIYVDPADRIWVCDAYNKRIQVFEYVKEQSRPAQMEHRPVE